MFSNQPHAFSHRTPCFLKYLAIACFFTLAACQGNVKHSSRDSGDLSESDLPISQAELHIDDHLALNPDCFVSAEDYQFYSASEQVDFWDRLRQGYGLPQLDNHRIDMERAWYQKHPAYMLRVTERGAPYLFHIVEELERRNMPLEIALLPIVESAFDPFAYSHGRASGMWQIIPGTGKMLGLKQNWWYDGRRDVVASTDAALRYLEGLHKRFDGDWLLALAAYNSGAGNVSKAIRRNKSLGKPIDFWNLRLPKETQAYVPRLLALSQLFLEPEKYQLSFFPVANLPTFAAVDVGSQIDLAQAARLANLDIETLYLLNPAFNRWATDPQGPHKLLVPIEKAELFEQQLTGIPPQERVTWQRYTIQRGDTLSGIAKKFELSVKSLKSINKLNSHIITAGKTLMVPVAAQQDEHYSLSLDQRVSQRYQQVAQAKSGQSIDYTVKAGDSLWDISRHYKVGVRQLAKWNSMAPTDPIKPGQKLKIWTTAPSSQTSSKASPQAAPGNNAGIIRKVSYKVRSGDSLARIAQKFRVSIKDITRWNQISTAKYLQPGQSLTLYVDVTNNT